MLRIEETRPLRDAWGVHCTLTPTGAPPRALSFVLRSSPGTDDLRVLDVVVDGVSLLRNYRSAFTKTLRTAGVEGLLERLRSR